jgi:peptide/nickel transport system permease protein
MGRRVLLMVPVLFAISVVAFVIIQLPPGDYLSTMVSQLKADGNVVDQAEIAQLTDRYGLSDPIFLQYVKWISQIVLHGDFGMSFAWNRPVSSLLADRLPLTVLLAVTTLLFTWIVAFPIGVYSAVRQYSAGDYAATTFGFLGLAVPEFLIALVLMWIGLKYFGQSVGGLFSPEWQDAPWNLGKLLDLLGHLWVPILVLGMAGTAGLIRVLRANLLDELHKPYVVAARARGMPERRLTVKYPLRVALNPFVSTVGWVLPGLVSGEVIVAQVLSLPTTGPLLLAALKGQDMYLAGSIILVVSVLTVIGTLISDILLAWLDPRVRVRYR